MGAHLSAIGVHDLDDHVAWVRGGGRVSQPGSLDYAVEGAVARGRAAHLTRVLLALLRWERRQRLPAATRWIDSRSPRTLA